MPTTKKINYVAGLGLIITALGGIFGAYPLVGLGIILIIIGAVFGWDNRWKCDYCDDHFKHINECKSHEEECEKKFKSKSVWKCECGETFNTKEALEKHCNEKSKKDKSGKK